MLTITINRQTLENAVARRNLSRKELASLTAMSRSHLSRVIWGKIRPSSAFRQRLLECFPECTFDDLFTIQEEKESHEHHQPSGE